VKILNYCGCLQTKHGVCLLVGTQYRSVNCSGYVASNRKCEEEEEDDDDDDDGYELREMRKELIVP
jgi:hypothetical protein